MTPSTSAAGATLLEAAEVVANLGGSVMVRLQDGSDTEARLALTVPYKPLRGDEVLVIGRGERHFVIGVLEGSGQLRLQAKNVTVHAEGGRLRLTAGRDIGLRSHKLQLLAHEQLAWAANTIHRAAHSYKERISGKLSLLTRDADQLLRGQWQLQAQRISAKVTNTFFANGEIIRID